MTQAQKKRAALLAELKQKSRLPLIVAPMFLVSGPELVLAACRAGVIGAFPFPNARNLETLENWLHSITEGLENVKHAAPFAANITTHASYDRLDEELALIRRYKPAIVITALGGPAPAIEAAHSYGGLVFADVNTLGFARKAVEKGADGLVLVSAGAGGHTGALAGFAFVSAVRAFFDGPIVLAGAMSDGYGVRAAEVLGADFAYMGTRFITAEESLASGEYREMILKATAEDLVLSASITGAPAYYLRASLLKMGLDPDAVSHEAQRPKGFNLSGSQDKIKAWRDIWSAGHGVGAVKDIRPTARIIADIQAEYDRACDTPSTSKAF